MPVKVDKTDRLKPVEIDDIFAAGLQEGEDQEVDPKDDFQAAAPPPPKGKYALALFGDEKYEENKRQSGTVYYTKRLPCKIQNEGEWKNSIVEYKGSTACKRGKKTSSMQGVLTMAGVRFPPGTIKDLVLARTMAKVLKKDVPVVLWAECDWDCWDAHDKDNIVRLKAGMDNFPKDAKGRPIHVLKNAKGEECFAKLKVVKWIGKVGATSQAVNGAPVVAVKPPTPAPVPVISTPVVEELSFDDDGEVVID